jgi:hypothetical protein
MTTAARPTCTLGRSYVSFVDANLDPIVYAEPGSTATEALTKWNKTVLGAWHNWKQAIEDSLKDPHWDCLLSVQDDVLIHPQGRTLIETYLEEGEWAEDQGFISLYLPSHYGYRVGTKPKPMGIHKIAENCIYGACCLLFPRSVIIEYTQSQIWDTWVGLKPQSDALRILEQRRENPSLIKHVDSAITMIAKSLGLFPYYFVPSICQHVGDTSSLGHAPATGKRVADRVVDFQQPIPNEILRMH